MYSVSSKYRQDMKEPVARLSLRGVVGGESFTEENLVGGSFSITNQCVDNDEILLGAAYVGELQATFKDININRYEWVGKTITAYHSRTFSNNISEEIPLGVYTIAEAVWSADGIAVTAYDNMSKLDKTAEFNATSGTAYGILSNICLNCGLTFGMSQAQVEALPNGSEIFGLWAENDIETYRDMISLLAQALASIVLVDRQGRIYLKAYDMTSVDTIGAENRFIDATYSDFESRYSGISIIDISSKQTRYYGTEPDIYLTYNLGSNPFLQYGTPTKKEQMARAILNSLAATAYVPFSCTMLGDPAYDLGDVVTLTGGMGDSTKHFVIQKYSYNLHNNYTAEGVGKNPDVANARSKTDKQIQGLLNNQNQNEVQYYIYSNTEQIVIGDTQTKTIIDIRFASLKATTVIFHAEVLLDVDTAVSGITYNDLVGTVTYYINASEVLERHPVETWVDGDHILHLLYPIQIGEAQLTRFVVTLTANGGKITIPINGIDALISGQGLVATSEWDGYIDLEDTIGEITLGGIEVENNIIDEVEITQDTPYSLEFTEELGEIDLGGFTLENNMSEELLIDNDFMNQYTHSELSARTHEYYNNMFIYG